MINPIEAEKGGEIIKKIQVNHEAQKYGRQIIQISIIAINIYELK